MTSLVFPRDPEWKPNPDRDMVIKLPLKDGTEDFVRTLREHLKIMRERRAEGETI